MVSDQDLWDWAYMQALETLWGVEAKNRLGLTPEMAVTAAEVADKAVAERSKRPSQAVVVVPKVGIQGPWPLGDRGGWKEIPAVEAERSIREWADAVGIGPQPPRPEPTTVEQLREQVEYYRKINGELCDQRNVLQDDCTTLESRLKEICKTLHVMNEQGRLTREEHQIFSNLATQFQRLAGDHKPPDQSSLVAINERLRDTIAGHEREASSRIDQVMSLEKQVAQLRKENRERGEAMAAELRKLRENAGNLSPEQANPQAPEPVPFPTWEEATATATTTAEPPFEVGDLVECVDDDGANGNLLIGGQYTLTVVNENIGCVGFRADPGDIWNAKRFKLVAKADCKPVSPTTMPPEGFHFTGSSPTEIAPNDYYVVVYCGHPDSKNPVSFLIGGSEGSVTTTLEECNATLFPSQEEAQAAADSAKQPAGHTEGIVIKRSAEPEKSTEEAPAPSITPPGPRNHLVVYRAKPGRYAADEFFQSGRSGFLNSPTQVNYTTVASSDCYLDADMAALVAGMFPYVDNDHEKAEIHGPFGGPGVSEPTKTSYEAAKTSTFKKRTGWFVSYWPKPGKAEAILYFLVASPVTGVQTDTAAHCATEFKSNAEAQVIARKWPTVPGGNHHDAIVEQVEVPDVEF